MKSNIKMRIAIEWVGLLLATVAAFAACSRPDTKPSRSDQGFRVDSVRSVYVWTQNYLSHTLDAEWLITRAHGTIRDEGQIKRIVKRLRTVEGPVQGEPVQYPWLLAVFEDSGKRLACLQAAYDAMDLNGIRVVQDRQLLNSIVVWVRGNAIFRPKNSKDLPDLTDWGRIDVDRISDTIP